MRKCARSRKGPAEGQLKGQSNGNHIVFESLPTVVAQIIEHKTWKSYGKSNFADYVLDATSNGLGVNSNQRLWILRCSLDVHGKHIKEWADVLDRVEKMVRVQARESGDKIRSFNGQSLETLSKNVRDVAHKITYLPSRSGAGVDRHVLNLRKNKPEIFKRVVKGELSI